MKKRKLLFNVLLLACILTFAKTNVSAHQKKVPSGYTGIYNIDDLAGIENNPSGKYILMGDIDMTEVKKKVENMIMEMDGHQSVNSRVCWMEMDIRLLA